MYRGKIFSHFPILGQIEKHKKEKLTRVFSGSFIGHLSGDGRMDDREKEEINVIESDSEYEETSSESESDSEEEENEGEFVVKLFLVKLYFYSENFSVLTLILADVKTEPAEEEQTGPTLTPGQRILRLGVS